MASSKGSVTAGPSQDAGDINREFESTSDLLAFLKTQSCSALPSTFSSTETSPRALHQPDAPRPNSDQEQGDACESSEHLAEAALTKASTSRPPTPSLSSGATSQSDQTRSTQFIIDGATKALEKWADQRASDDSSDHQDHDEKAKMAAPFRPQLVFVDGNFAELAQEMADYLQIGDEVKPLLAKEQRHEALDKIVRASTYIHSAPEREFTGAYNFLIHIVINLAKEPKKYLRTVCTNLHKEEIKNSPVNGPGLALGAFQSIFNLLGPQDDLRYNVYMEILKFAKAHNMYENVKPGLHNLHSWLKQWDTDDENQRKMYMDIAEMAFEAGEERDSHMFLLEAMRTFDASDDEEVKSEEAQQISLRALRMAILANNRFDFQDLRNIPTVQALADSHPVWSQLLDIFAEQELEDYNDFREEHEGWVEKEKLDPEKLQRKMRLLTFASLAASTSSKEIEYGRIAKALQVPIEEVERWAIDVIRAGLVEGKMSQQRKVFLVHRTTYRVFGEKQWRELGAYTDQWKDTLKGVLASLERAKDEATAQKERDVQELERRTQNASLGDGANQGQRRGGRQNQNQDRNQYQSQPQQRKDGDD